MCSNLVRMLVDPYWQRPPWYVHDSLGPEHRRCSHRTSAKLQVNRERLVAIVASCGQMSLHVSIRHYRQAKPNTAQHSATQRNTAQHSLQRHSPQHIQDTASSTLAATQSPKHAKLGQSSLRMFLGTRLSAIPYGIYVRINYFTIFYICLWVCNLNISVHVG